MKRSVPWILKRPRLAARLGGALCVLVATSGWLAAQAFVPGTGQRSTKVSDDFEDPKWSYVFHLPKGSFENDKQQRLPSGAAANGRWFEGALRGQPDVIQRVATPEGGLAGSSGSLLMQSRHTGVPGSSSFTVQQDDLIANVAQKEGRSIPVSWSPSVVVRVYLPPWDQWENRTGGTFGFRASCQTHKTSSTGRWGRSANKPESYWPGLFIQFIKGDGRATQDSARILLRAGPQGQDLAGPQIKNSGWWTLGMSFSPDGQVHYYAHEGVDDLTAKDHLTSQYPYGFHCEQLDTYFFDIVNGRNPKYAEWLTKV